MTTRGSLAESDIELSGSVECFVRVVVVGGGGGWYEEGRQRIR